MNSIKTTYKSFDSNTRLIIRTTLITTISLILTSIYAYNSNQYDLIRIWDDMLEASKSVMIVGFSGALLLEYFSKAKKE